MTTPPRRRTRERLLTIGAVVPRGSSDEFPDISISKIRYLEDQGLLQPRRTQGGYRLFSEDDVERLETILRLQRDEFLPLRVIRERARAAGARRSASAGGRPGSASAEDEIDARRALRARRHHARAGARARGVRAARAARSGWREALPRDRRRRSPPRAPGSRATASTRATCARSARPPTARRRCSSSSSRRRSARATPSAARAGLEDLQALAELAQELLAAPVLARRRGRLGEQLSAVDLDGAKIRDVPDFPKPGIVFKDITPLLADPEALHADDRRARGVGRAAAARPRPRRGGARLHPRRGARVPARLRLRAGAQAREAAAETVSASYALEYGVDALEVHADAIPPARAS